MNNTRGKILWMTRTAVMLAMLIGLQALTKPLGQLVTGSCVNAVLAAAGLLCGISSGVTIALLSPGFAYLLGIAPQIVTVPAIMAGNVCYVLLLVLLTNRGRVWKLRWPLALVCAAAVKFGVLYLLVAKIICGVAAPKLLAAGVLKPPMLQALPAMFAWPQLITALIGGGVAIVLVPVLKKALKR